MTETTSPPDGSIDSEDARAPWRRQTVRKGPLALGALIFVTGMIGSFVRFEVESNAQDRRDERQAGVVLQLGRQLCRSTNSLTRATIVTRESSLDAANERVEAAQENVDTPLEVTSYPGYAESPEFFRVFLGRVVDDSIASAQNELVAATEDRDRFQGFYDQAAAVPLVDCDNDDDVDSDDYTSTLVASTTTVP